MEAYKQQGPEVEFQAATECFDALRRFMGSKGALSLIHSDLEREVAVRGREVMRLLIQDHLDLRARLECPTPVTGEDGILRTLMRDTHRPLVSIFGEVAVWRVGAHARNHDSRFPLDAELNLPEQRQSHGVRERVAEEVAKGSFDEAVESIAKTTGVEVSKLQAERLAAEAAKDFDAFYAQRPPEEVRAVGKEIMALTTDGKGIVVRKKDLRKATRQAAEESSHKLKTRLSKGEKRNRKRMATVAAVYSIEPHIRTADDILRDLRPVADTARPPRPKPQHKRVWASVQKEQGEVIGEIFDEAERRDPDRARIWCGLVDGSEIQRERLQTEALRRKIELIIVLDVIHALEYLWKAAFAFHADGTKEAEAWVMERFRGLLEGRVSDVAAGIRRSATLRGLDARTRKPVDTCVDYFLKNKHQMKYDEYLRLGLPIATGVIEGACRHLVKDRMDLTGARWSLDGADAVLRLRALRSSGDFAAYWEFHLRQEQERNHHSRYQGGVVRSPLTKAERPTLRLIVS